MAGRRVGLSGLAVAMAATGGFLVYSGIRNVPPLEGLRELATGRLPAPRPVAPTVVNFTAPEKIDSGIDVPTQFDTQPGVTSGFESRIVTAARKYLNVPYRFGGHDPSGFDCSGLVTWVLHHDLGIDLSTWSAGANNTHTVTSQFLVTNGLVTVPRAQAQSGDLVCWVGHIGIALNKDRMINAPHAGAVVREDPIWGNPIFRRVR